MERETSAQPRTYQVALTILVSTATALAVVLALRSQFRRLIQRMHDERAVHQPIQPGINTAAPVDGHAHFSEDIVLPGITETGAEISRQDSTEGRSPEGV